MPASESKLPERYLSVKEYARLFGVSEKTVHRYLKKGLISKPQPGGRHCHIGIPQSALGSAVQPQTDDSTRSPPTAPDADTAAPPSAESAARKRPLPKPSWMR